jgi:hypothetical protein
MVLMKMMKMIKKVVVIMDEFLLSILQTEEEEE